jgi:hypothetical protein
MIFHRRAILRMALKMSALGFASLLPSPVRAMVKPGMRSITGDVRINGVAAQMDMLVNPGDTVTTGPGAQATLVSGFNAYLIRGDGEIEFPEDNTTEKVLRVVSGQIVSVFGPGELTIDTPLATIGIRGTGAYVEVWQERNYVCLCYGEAQLLPKLDPHYAENLKTTHHEGPRNFYAKPKEHGGKVIEPADMVNHTDEELILLESLVGRIPMFGPKPIKMPKKDGKGGYSITK